MVRSSWSSQPGQIKRERCCKAKQEPALGHQHWRSAYLRRNCPRNGDTSSRFLRNNFGGADGIMESRFWKRLRAGKKFSGPDELRTQIAKDIASQTDFSCCCENSES